MTAVAHPPALRVLRNDSTAADKLRTATRLLADFDKIATSEERTLRLAELANLVIGASDQLADQLEEATAQLQARNRLLDARAEEIDSLRTELRDHQALIASFADCGVHLEIDWANRRYVVSREYRREAGVYTDWNEAVNAARQLKATFPGEPLADKAAPKPRGD